MPTDTCTVWWLYGPPCAGKSITAWELYAHLLDGPRAYVDIDQIGMCYPERDDDAGRYRLKDRAAGVLLRRFAAAGARRVVVSGVVDEESLHAVGEQVGGMPVTFCRLRTRPEELRRRLQTRYGPDETARALAEARDWDRRDPGHVVVDTDTDSPQDVAARVLQALGGLKGAAPAPARTPVSPTTRPTNPQATSPTTSADPGQAVLVCGPTGVGKSTLGFGLFRTLLRAGRPSAYLDLQQISFLAPAWLRDSRGHRRTATCVADLWAQFQAAGARDLVLTGSLEQAEDVQHYRSALGGTSLRVCRLTAGRDQLRERILARTRGEGPPLAGDLLLGRSASDVGTVLQAALAQQDHLERAGIGDLVLDVDSLNAEAATRRLATLLRSNQDDAGR